MLSIGTFSKISTVTTNTLRYYDEIGLLKPVKINSENGYRYYDVSQLKTILLINKLKRYEFSLEQIAEVLHSSFDDGLLLMLFKQKQQILQEKLAHYGYVLKQLQDDMANLEKGVSIMAYLNEIQVQLVETQPRNIFFVRKKMNVEEEFGPCMGALYENLLANKLTALAPPMSIYHDEEDFDPNNLDVEIAIPVYEEAEQTRKLPGYLCAMASVKGPYKEVLPSAYAKIREWIEVVGYNIDDAPFEVYVTDPMRTEPENYITEVYFPVISK